MDSGSVAVCFNDYRRLGNLATILLLVVVFYFGVLNQDWLGESSVQHPARPPIQNWDNFIFEEPLAVTGDVSEANGKKTVGESEKFKQLMMKNISSYNLEDFNLFWTFKESQYRSRQEMVKSFCNKQSEKFSQTVRKNSFIIDERDGLGYCQIAKVASSTWCMHFIKLANASESEMHRWREALQIFAPSLWSPPKNWLQVWPSLTSMVIVRHPMSRLSSVYYQKFVELANHKGWKGVIKNIINTYREDPKSGDQTYATPNEYLRYVLDNVDHNHDAVDQHWRPQHLSCPFCLVNYTVYSKLEEQDQDGLYFFTRKAGLLDFYLENMKMKLNSEHAASSSEREFWKEADANLILRVYQTYQLDFQMFNYSVSDYVNQLGYLYKLDGLI